MATQEELEQSKIRIRELEEQVKQLTNENTVLKAEKKLVVVENIGLREKLEEHDVVSRTQMQQVSSLTNLAIQDREWLEYQITYRKQMLQQRKRETAATLAKRRATMEF